MRKFLVPLLMITTQVQAQDFLQSIQQVNEKIAEQEIDKKNEVSGEFFNSLAKPKPETPENCEEENKPDETRYEVVLIAKTNSQMSSMETLPKLETNISTLGLKIIYQSVPENIGSLGLSESAVINRTQDIWKSGWVSTPSPNFDPKSTLGSELLIESIVQAAGRSTLSEKDLSKNIASIAGTVYKTEEEKFTFLAGLSNRLYRNYNVSRNPGYDNPKNNPFDAELPAGDITLNEMMKAAADFNYFGGGVCNDISESVIMVGEHLFPDKDVLAVNSGSHFGVVIADGKKNRIIDGSSQYSLQNNLLLDPKMSPTNLRISKVEDGKLKEIAVVDTEMGQLTEAAFQTGKNLLKISPDINSVIGHFKKRDAEFAIGQGALSDSKVTIVVAKYHTKHDKWNAYVGVGGTGQTYYSDGNTKYQVHFRAGAERNIFEYVHPMVDVRFDSGIRAHGMYTLNAIKNNDSVQRVDLSAGLDIVNTLSANYGKHAPNGVQLRGVLEVEHTAGPKSWGATTGAISYMNPGDVGTIIKNSSFHLNQINADVTAEKKIKSDLSAVGNVHYQGSNIGQSVSALAGLNIKVPTGAELLVYVSHSDSSLKGFETKHSLLASPQGTAIGAKYKSKSGVEVGAQLRSISGKPSVEAQVRVPLGPK